MTRRKKRVGALLRKTNSINELANYLFLNKQMGKLDETKRAKAYIIILGKQHQEYDADAALA